MSLCHNSHTSNTSSTRRCKGSANLIAPVQDKSEEPSYFEISMLLAKEFIKIEPQPNFSLCPIPLPSFPSTGVVSTEHTNKLLPCLSPSQSLLLKDVILPSLLPSGMLYSSYIFIDPLFSVGHLSSLPHAPPIQFPVPGVPKARAAPI